MKKLTVAALLVLVCAGCASNEEYNLDKFITQARLIVGNKDDLLSASTDAVQAMGYRPYLGNPGMVVGSQSDPTALTPVAFVAGTALVPLAIITWPLATNGATHDSGAWWPMLPLGPWVRSFDEHEIYVWVSEEHDAGITVTAKAAGSEPRRSSELANLWTNLGARFQVLGDAPPAEWRRVPETQPEHR